MVTTLGLNNANTEANKGKNLILFYCGLILLRNKKRRIKKNLQEIMEDIGMSMEEE